MVCGGGIENSTGFYLCFHRLPHRWIAVLPAAAHLNQTTTFRPFGQQLRVAIDSNLFTGHLKGAAHSLFRTEGKGAVINGDLTARGINQQIVIDADIDAIEMNSWQ
ncbi:MAG: hypothetical protein ED554_02785 [Synechococcus sp. YX04-3]|nr:MAG: hypothetical protein ED554_02785 [Synechococcus sp. YX04-3]